MLLKDIENRGGKRRKLDLNYYPGWTRKSITFTIDDGNLKLDRKFLDVVKPAGLKGTFNLCTPLDRGAPEDYRRLYEGYEIANHCRYHAYAFTPVTARVIKPQLFDRETADRGFGYLTEEEGLYRVRTYGWCYLATDEKYMELVDDCQRELEEVFGKGFTSEDIFSIVAAAGMIAIAVVIIVRAFKAKKTMKNDDEFKNL